MSKTKLIHKLGDRGFTIKSFVGRSSIKYHDSPYFHTFLTNEEWDKCSVQRINILQAKKLIESINRRIVTEVIFKDRRGFDLPFGIGNIRIVKYISSKPKRTFSDYKKRYKNGGSHANIKKCDDFSADGNYTFNLNFTRSLYLEGGLPVSTYNRTSNPVLAEKNPFLKALRFHIDWPLKAIMVRGFYEGNTDFEVIDNIKAARKPENNKVVKHTDAKIAKAVQDLF